MVFKISTSFIFLTSYMIANVLTIASLGRCDDNEESQFDSGVSEGEDSCRNSKNPYCRELLESPFEYDGGMTHDAGEIELTESPYPSDFERNPFQSNQANGDSETSKEEKKRPKSTRESHEHPWFSFLLNPADMIMAPLVWDFFPLTFNVNLAGNFVGLDLRPMLFFYGNAKMLAGGVAGARLLPMGEGLKGLYLLASVGAISVPAFVSLFEVGYTWYIDLFVIGIGATVCVMRGDGKTTVTGGPNLSLGVGI